MHEAAAVMAGAVVEGQLGRAVDVGLHGALRALGDEPVGDCMKATLLIKLICTLEILVEIASPGNQFIL